MLYCCFLFWLRNFDYLLAIALEKLFWDTSWGIRWIFPPQYRFLIYLSYFSERVYLGQLQTKFKFCESLVHLDLAYLVCNNMGDLVCCYNHTSMFLFAFPVLFPFLLGSKPQQSIPQLIRVWRKYSGSTSLLLWLRMWFNIKVSHKTFSPPPKYQNASTCSISSYLWA